VVVVFFHAGLGIVRPDQEDALLVVPWIYLEQFAHQATGVAWTQRFVGGAAATVVVSAQDGFPAVRSYFLNCNIFSNVLDANSRVYIYLYTVPLRVKAVGRGIKGAGDGGVDSEQRGIDAVA
jgi:hypothetical protein